MTPGGLYEIYRTDKAEEQLVDILAYVGEVAGRKAALDLLDRFERAFSDVARYPYLGVMARSRTLGRRGYRMLVVGRHLVFYKVDEAHRRVVVHGIFHGARDYEKWL